MLLLLLFILLIYINIAEMPDFIWLDIPNENNVFKNILIMFNFI